MSCIDSRNRFNPENRFIGDIENGERYPYACYTKEESDERYADKSTESAITELSEQITNKVDESELAALSAVVSGKADESECVDIRARLDALEYSAITINNFSATPSICEIGSYNTIILAWELNKVPVSQEINGVAVTGSTKQYDGVASNTTYVLTASDGRANAIKSVEVKFANNVYFGAADDTASVTLLSKVLSNDKTRTFEVNASIGQYIIYAIPARLGDVVFYVGGFEGGFEEPVEQIIVNASGYQELYKVYRSTNASLGETTVEVREG